MSVENFFQYARERQKIFLARRAGRQAPWTDDWILQQYRFCNVFREDDRTTIWFRENVRDPLRDSPEVLLATVLFRWFNRIETGEAMFLQSMFDDDTMNVPAWDAVVNLGSKGIPNLRSAIRAYVGTGPTTTGSYIIRGVPGYDKMNGVLKAFETFCNGEWIVDGALNCVPHVTSKLGWRAVADNLSLGRSYSEELRPTLESTWTWLRKVPFLGDFMAYEIVSDLRHTALLDRAPDVMAWANPGPGAARGAGRVLYGDRAHYRPSQKSELNSVMRDLLEMSRSPAYWPEDWPEWDMRTVEHTLCEFDKYERTRLGEGRPRQVFRG